MRKDDIPDESKKMCVLPDQTIEGLKICGKFTCSEWTDFIFTLVPFLAHLFNELIKVLLSHRMEFVLTERFNQDPVEVFFGQQRSRGGRSDNPSVTQYLHNTHADPDGAEITCSWW